MPTRALPTPSRNAADGLLPTISRRRSVVPTMSHRLLSASDVPPLPQLAVLVAADVVAVVQLTVVARATARANPGFGGEVTASAAVRADGGRKFVDAEQALAVAVTATAVARYTRSAAAVANVAAIAVVAVSARPQFGGAVVATAVVTAVRTALAAAQAVSVTPSAQIVAYGGQVAVGATTSLEVTAAAGAIGRLPANFTASAEVSASATRQIRMSATAAQAVDVTATAVVAVLVSATVTAAVSATATAALAYAPQRMVKSGAYTLPGNLSYHDVLGWAVDGAYPQTAVVNDRGLSVKAGVPITISAVVLRGGTNGGNRARIIDTEGNQIALVTSASPITIPPFSYTPPIATVLRIQAYAASGLGGNPTVPDDPGTYLLIEP